MNLVRLGEWDVTNSGKDCVDNHCLPPVQDFPVSLADFTIHPDFLYDTYIISISKYLGLDNFNEIFLSQYFK